MAGLTPWYPDARPRPRAPAPGQRGGELQGRLQPPIQCQIPGCTRVSSPVSPCADGQRPPRLSGVALYLHGGPPAGYILLATWPVRVRLQLVHDAPVCPVLYCESSRASPCRRPVEAVVEPCKAAAMKHGSANCRRGLCPGELVPPPPLAVTLQTIDTAPLPFKVCLTGSCSSRMRQQAGWRSTRLWQVCCTS